MFTWPERRECRPPDNKKQEPRNELKHEPTFPRDEKVERMDFLLSLRRRVHQRRALWPACMTGGRPGIRAAGLHRDRQCGPGDADACGHDHQPALRGPPNDALSKREHRVLDGRTGSGYHAAVSEPLAGAGVSVERYRRWPPARAQHYRLGYHHVTVVPATD